MHRLHDRLKIEDMMPDHVFAKRRLAKTKDDKLATVASDALYSRVQAKLVSSAPDSSRPEHAKQQNPVSCLLAQQNKSLDISIMDLFTVYDVSV